ncbi:MAG: hypothetical protein ACFE9Q_14360 [Candidatus Hodarchaeota archaeon]
MASGKIFCILGGILTLLGTYFFSFLPSLPGTYYYGLGFFLNIYSIFTSGWILYIIIAIIFIVFLLSGIFIIIGVKSKTLALIGSLFVLGFGVYMILAFYVFGLTSDITIFMAQFINAPLVEGIIPFDLFLGPFSLGTYILIGGGVLGLIGGIKGPSAW